MKVLLLLPVALFCQAAVKIDCEKKEYGRAHIRGKGFDPYEPLTIQYNLERKQKRRIAYTEYLQADEKGTFYKILGHLYQHDNEGHNELTVVRRGETIRAEYSWEKKK